MAKARKPSNTGAPSTEAEWLLLSAVYQRVFARGLTPEAAKGAISEPYRGGRLRMRATRLEYRARPDLRLAPGEKPPLNPPIVTPNCPLPVPSAGDFYWQHWDWGRSNASHHDPETKSLFRYEQIEVHPGDVSACLSDNAAPVPKPDDMRPPPRRRGPVVTHDWFSICAEIARRCVNPDTGRVRVTSNEAELARAVLLWCDETYDREPADSEMREAVKRVCAALRQVQK
jgi:hypothetical protein